nr:PREDICTED: uncharacterized protein LOC108222055 isoform X1 [Daucus carota subsp. sativus]
MGSSSDVEKVDENPYNSNVKRSKLNLTLAALLDDAILSDVPKKPSLSDVETLISFELGSAMRISVLKMDGTSFDVHVMNTATVKDLKLGIKKKVNECEQSEMGHRHISWSLGKQILEKLGYHYLFVCWLIHKEALNMSFAIWYRIGFLLSIKNKFVLPIFITFLMYTKAVFIWDQSAKNGHVMLLEYTFHGSYKINMQRERISNLGKEGQVL